MSEPAPQAERSPVTIRATVGTGVLGGLGAFAIVTAICTGIGMIEYAASGGRYHTWTWVKVGFLYFLSSCDVAVRALAVGHGMSASIVYRVPLLAGTALILWLVARAARHAVGSETVPGATVAGAAAAAIGFGVPGVLLALPANLRFPSHLPFELFVSPVRWQAVLLVPAVSAAGAATGVFLARRRSLAARSPWRARAVAWIEGGARMFVWALLLAFVGFLLTAAVRPAQTKAYVQMFRGQGRGGLFAAAHHVMLIPDQSIWLLAPSMGGTTRAWIDFGGPQLSRFGLTVRGMTYERDVPVDDSSPQPPERWRLNAEAWLFLLVPGAATVLGGRAAARGEGELAGRLIVGAGAGVVFAMFVALGVWASRAALPVPPGWLPRLSISADMPSTVLLAIAWGVVGGAIGALSVGRGTKVQDPATPEPG